MPATYQMRDRCEYRHDCRRADRFRGSADCHGQCRDLHEQLHAYLGDARLAKLVKSYIAARPSDRRSPRDFGRHVPDFLRQDPAFAAHAELAEIATLEKALADAFDGPDAEPLKLAMPRSR
jgi:hypothetical protein